MADSFSVGDEVDQPLSPKKKFPQPGMDDSQPDVGPTLHDQMTQMFQDSGSGLPEGQNQPLGTSGMGGETETPSPVASGTIPSSPYTPASTQISQPAPVIADPATPAAPETGGAPATNGAQPYSDLIMQNIQDLLKRGNAPLTADDPTLRAQFDPISASLQRAGQRTKAQAAERAAYQGTSVGGAGGPLDAEMNSINEDTGNQEGKLMSQMVTQELQARRQDIQNALQYAQGEEKQRLLVQQQAIDRELQQQEYYDTLAAGIGQNEYQFNQNFGQNLAQ